MAKLPPHEINRIHGALKCIGRLDATALDIAEDIEKNAEQWGGKARDVFGRNRLGQWKNRFLGEVAATAIINELVREREELRADIDEFAEVSPPSLSIPQHPDRENR